MKIINKGKNIYFVLIIGVMLTSLLIFIEKEKNFLLTPSVNLIERNIT